MVDAGVGTNRRPLLVTAEKHIFLAPDNGVLSLVYEREERLSVRHITAEHYFLQPMSNTFHGRDLFSAVAGWLSKGVEVAKFGEEVTDFVRFAAPRPKPVNEKLMKGVVLKADKFGNLITNFTPKDVPQLFQAEPPPFKILIGKSEVTRMRQTYAGGAAGEPRGCADASGNAGAIGKRIARGNATRYLAGVLASCDQQRTLRRQQRRAHAGAARLGQCSAADDHDGVAAGVTEVRAETGARRLRCASARSREYPGD